jgi:hypothetical protein
MLRGYKTSDDVIAEMENIANRSWYSGINVGRENRSMKNEALFLYQWDALNYRGVTVYSKSIVGATVPYVQVIAEELLRLSSPDYNYYLRNLPPLSRNNYRQTSHNVTAAKHTLLKSKGSGDEELIVLQMYIDSQNPVGKLFPFIGKIFDYQVPLYVNDGDGLRAIDLVSYTDNHVWLIELKKCDSKETLLRALLEIQSYYQVLDIKKFLRDYPILAGKTETDIRKAIVIACDNKDCAIKQGSIREDYELLRNGDLKFQIIQNLLDHYGIEVYVI